VKRLKAIIFDVDGTLADTEEVHRLAFNHSFGEFGLEWNWAPELYEQLLSISGGRERIAAYGTELRGRFSSEAEFEQFVAALHKAKTRKYAAMLTEGEVPLRPGVARVIQQAREADLALAIATSSALSNAETLLDNNLPPGWRDWFSAIETCDSVAKKKPSPAVYRAVLDDIATGPEYVVAVEDTQNGLRAATGAGLTTVVTTHRFTRHHDFYGAELVVDSMGEPDVPFTVAAGHAYGRRYLDIELLDELLLNQVQATASPAVARATA
jgi:HAD superfamily hydrolase (TIGR01509 family)